MIKGVNRQVVEVKETESEYFERILFFVKPEFAYLSEGKLKDRADIIASSASKAVPTKIKSNRTTEILRNVLFLLSGVAMGILVCMAIK